MAHSRIVLCAKVAGLRQKVSLGGMLEYEVALGNCTIVWWAALVLHFYKIESAG